ncbi:methionine--tRNA ligase, chloroplastic/mitochondrial-like [Tasmannia lanceolata]|uniref:methionine--tRNA ligase, chloroplastic/mitochondrial-like n=1 Tax=Tasmannia lanceolata TaxID=3420 RepID=UPI0040638CFE
MATVSRVLQLSVVLGLFLTVGIWIGLQFGWRVFTKDLNVVKLIHIGITNDAKWGGLKTGQVMEEPKPIFARIEVRKVGEDEGDTVQNEVKDNKRIKQTQAVAEA